MRIRGSIRQMAGVLAACVIVMLCVSCYEVHYFPGRVTFTAAGGTKSIRSSKESTHFIRLMDIDHNKLAPIQRDTLPDGTIVGDETISVFEWAEAKVIENGTGISISAQPNNGKKRKLRLEVSLGPEWQLITIEQKGK